MSRSPDDTPRGERTRLAAIVAWTAAALVLLSLIVTLDRNPTNESDAQLYAAIAHSWLKDGSGVPSVIRNSPSAVDHVAFYGPVYFDLTAISFRIVGPTKVGARIVSLAGAILLALAAALLSSALGGPGWPWSCLIVLLAPEVRDAATDGTMETLAVGLSVAGLALFVRALTSPRHAAVCSIAAGVALGLAALTTPRTYPFIAAFLAAGLLRVALDRQGGRRLLTTTACLLLVVAAWTTHYHGSVIAWARYMAFVLTHEDSDVAIIGPRMWAFGRSRTITPLFVAVAGIAAAWLLDRAARAGRRNLPAEFALLAAWIALVVTFVGMDLTFLFGIYFAVPLLVVVAALPWARLEADPRAVKAAAATLLAAFAGLTLLTDARVALTWVARDPERVTTFVRAHVPHGAAVIGPEGRYFFAVENAGASYWTADANSFADWTRWVPAIDPGATAAARRLPPLAPPVDRFLLWPADDWLPEGYDCAAGHRVAAYRTAPPSVPALSEWLGGLDVGYPNASLYRLPPGCPSGYDPTRQRR